MYQNPFISRDDINFRVPMIFSYIRILHAVPDAPQVNVYANGSLIAKNLSYKGFTNYIKVPAGNYEIELYAGEKKGIPVFKGTVSVAFKSIYTIAATGTANSISLLPVLEPYGSIPISNILVRFVHLSPNAPAVDVSLQSGKILFKNVEFKEVTGYTIGKPGLYNVLLKVANTDKKVLYVPNIKLRRTRFYTIYVVGFAGKNPPLELLIPLDGNSYLKL